MGNLLIGFAANQLDEVHRVAVFVGGFSKVRKLLWEYKAVFSLFDVIEICTRLARVIENGQAVIKDLLTDLELFDFDKASTLEAFNSDGLRSLLFTVKANNMYEKILRYPGYVNKINLLATSGFFS